LHRPSTHAQVAFLAGFIETTIVPVVASSLRMLRGARAQIFFAAAANRLSESSDLLANIPSHVDTSGWTGFVDVKLTHAADNFSIKYAVITRCLHGCCFLSVYKVSVQNTST
jgi:hypothetical protein